MRNILRRLLDSIALARRSVDQTDLFVFGGLACTACGVAQIYTPAAWIVVGVVLFWLGMRGS